HSDGGSQRTADQALDLLGTPVDPTRARFARGARLRCPRQHRILRGDPALTGPLLVWWRLVVPTRGTEHPGVAHVDERRAFGVEVDARLDRYRPDLIHLPAIRSRLGQLDLSSQSADHEDAELEKNDERQGEQQWRKGIYPGSHHVGPDEDPDPELQPVALQEGRAHNPRKAEHRHREWQLEGDAEDRDENQDEVDVLVGKGQVPELRVANPGQEPQGDRQREEGEPHPHREQRDRRGNEADGEATLVATQARGNEGPDLPDDDRTAQDEPGEDADLEEEQEPIDWANVNQPLVADHFMHRS